MKMVKSLLLGSAAGLVAIAGAQAADLPVKAKPVQYVKICSLYGVGFYYIPGTDMCLKIGGWVRAEYAYGDNGSLTLRSVRTATSITAAPTTATWRARGYITADARNQTAYGTVRAYIAVGVQQQRCRPQQRSERVQRQPRLHPVGGLHLRSGAVVLRLLQRAGDVVLGHLPGSDTGDPGWQCCAYTAQFGNGFSATISAEDAPHDADHRRQRTGGIAGCGAVSRSRGCQRCGTGIDRRRRRLRRLPGSGRRRQPARRPGLGFGAGHGCAAIEVNAATTTARAAATGIQPVIRVTKLGFAVGGGIKLNAPMIGKGDYFQAQVNYTEGALRYVFMTPNTNWGNYDGNAMAFGVLSDAVYGGTAARVGGCEPAPACNLTTAWSVNAAYEHFWNAQWRTSVYGGYAERQLQYAGQRHALRDARRRNWCRRW